MKEEWNCPLSQSLLDFLQEAARDSVDTDTLADHLHYSPQTVKEYFKRIFELLEVHNRADAITKAVRMGWIAIPVEDSVNKQSTRRPKDKEKDSSRERERERVVLNRENVLSGGLARLNRYRYNPPVRFPN